MTEILQEKTKLPVLWEPLHLKHVPEFGRLNMSWEQIVPENERWDELEEAFEKLLRGRILNPWCCSMSHPMRFLISERMIVKFCRVNGMLPWLTKRFQFRRKPILLLRHPFSVAASQLEHPGFEHLTGRFSLPSSPYNEVFLKHKALVDFIQSKAERQVFVWCMLNSVPLKSERHNKDWVTVFYEDLLERPEFELERVCKEWGLDFNTSDLLGINKPSQTTVGEKDFKDVSQQLSSWKRRFSAKEVRRMEYILDSFEIEEYSASLRPIKGLRYT